jgi:predicted alpha/beta-hydrolase family hydrolase
MAHASGTDVAGYVAEGPGLSAYALADDTVYGPYVTTARGLEPAMAYCGLRDRTARGRQEEGELEHWLRFSVRDEVNAALDLEEIQVAVLDRVVGLSSRSGQTVGPNPPSSDHSTVQVLEVEAPPGRARVHLHAAHRPRAGLVLGHGAGGGVEAPDMVAARDVALAEGVSVGLMEQPYRVAGRRSPAPASQLDATWMVVVSRLRERELQGLPLLVGGRSLGARVACRTAGLADAVAVLCLAFPLQPPRRAGSAPRPSRLAELDGVAVPTLVVQGTRDRFGMPPAGRQRKVVEVAGDHSLKADLPAVAAAVQAWLADLLS